MRTTTKIRALMTGMVVGFFSNISFIFSVHRYNGYSFGGWTTPLIKQYDGTTDVCDIGADLNFY